jgi:hypothetical protein
LLFRCGFRFDTAVAWGAGKGTCSVSGRWCGRSGGRPFLQIHRGVREKNGKPPENQARGRSVDQTSRAGDERTAALIVQSRGAPRKGPSWISFKSREGYRNWDHQLMMEMRTLTFCRRSRSRTGGISSRCRRRCRRERESGVDCADARKTTAPCPRDRRTWRTCRLVASDPPRSGIQRLCGGNRGRALRSFISDAGPASRGRRVVGAKIDHVVQTRAGLNIAGRRVLPADALGCQAYFRLWRAG